MCKEDFIISAINNLKGNKGTATKGVDEKTLDGMEKVNIQEIIDKLKKEEYKFSPTKKIMIPKPGKKKKRPLGIPSFEDRLVQDMIRMILEAIYEPVFTIKHEDVNYGFRPKRSCQQAIEVTKQKRQNLEWCIEGDVSGAYDNVSHKILLKILREKIKDEKFLKLIENGLKSGSIHQGNYEHTIIGTPQGGIASPILFNIYISKFDEFILGNIREKIEMKNIQEGRRVKPATRSYNRLDNRIRSCKGKIQKIIDKNGQNISRWDPTIREEFTRILKEKNQYVRKRLKTPFLDKKKSKIKNSLCEICR